MNFKKLTFLSFLIFSSFFSNSSNSTENFWATKDLGEKVGFEIFSVDSTTGSTTSYGVISREDPLNYENVPGGILHRAPAEMKISETGKLFMRFNDPNDGSWNYFNPEDGTLTPNQIPDPWTASYTHWIEKNDFYSDNGGNIKLQLGDDKLVEKKSTGEIQIGGDTNDIDITAEGLNIDGNPLITKKDNGEIHIGKNSLITTSEEQTLSDGRKVQPLYAKDADGNRIPINIDGSKLLIDGVEVTAGADSAQVTTNKNNISTNTSNIKNLGEGVAGSTALTAALSALPHTSKESKLSCGVGTGAYSSRYAIGFGCASKVNERVDVNAGGSYVFGGSKSYGGGTLDSGVVKAGFVFKLGELNKSSQISFNDRNILDQKISVLKESNIILKAAVEESKAKNKEIISQNQKLLARLEKLENIALKFQSNSEMISVAAKD